MPGDGFHDVLLRLLVEKDVQFIFTGLSFEVFSTTQKGKCHVHDQAGGNDLVGYVLRLLFLSAAFFQSGLSGQVFHSWHL